MEQNQVWQQMEPQPVKVIIAGTGSYQNHISEFVEANRWKLPLSREKWDTEKKETRKEKKKEND